MGIASSTPSEERTRVISPCVAAHRMSSRPLRAAGRWAVVLSLVTAFPGSRLGAQQDTSHVRARVSGVVFDSISMRPLAGAIVQLVNTRDVPQARSVATGTDGAFAFDSLTASTYLLGFFHATLDSLGLQPPLAQLDVRTSGDIRAILATPSARTLRTQLCGPRAEQDSIGLFVGFVRSATTALGLARATVRAQWSEITIGADGVHRVTPSVQAETGEHGGVALCGLPVGGTLAFVGWSGADSSGFTELEMPASGFLRRDLYVGTARAVALRDSADTTLLTTVRRGDGVVRGVVRGADGRPLTGARLTLWGSGVEATTTSTGTFRLEEVPPGTQTLEARALGFLPVRAAVDVLSETETVRDLHLESFGTYLDTVKVTAKSVYMSRERRGFEDRRKRGFGTFMDEGQIERRNPIYVADLVRMTPGVQVVPGRFGHRILMRGTGFQAYCSPVIFVDGVRMMNPDGDLDAFVNVQDIRLLEVYSRGSSMPVQFQTLEGCGSIVIWTGGREGVRQRGRK